ncbi:MAG: hemolysin III family protein [Winogradskyella sp.]|nr:hemolysin III family protein [Winogradskyella sp.]MBT8376691.1 hemolysin III family protein [Bacteroidia bacterium]NNF86702.1 hemolysin III family protein [Winogradskyella sp.]NNK39074.1 hemolysin III family protein [Winogradskyella sp.]NNL83637.1 hemolysin III family protein [Winogradskyella sp.]
MRVQTKLEELLNAWTHGIGTVFGVIAIILLLFKVNTTLPNARFSVVVYGLSIIILFLASTLYHSVKHDKQKHYFRIVDHISIYLLIAGTYTPVLLLSLPESNGWILFWVVWAIAGLGTVLKIFFTGKYEILSTLLYLVMGWLIVFDFSNLSEAIGPNGILYLFAGGLFYTVGIIFYALQRIPYNHVIWHLFVLGGAISHFLMIYLYII